MKRLAVMLWFSMVILGFSYSQETVYLNGAAQKWSFSGLGLFGFGLLIASIWISIKTYRLLRVWLHQQGLFDRSARLPIRLNFLLPFVICFFYFEATSRRVVEGATIETARGWGDPAAGAVCFLLLSIFFIVLQLHDLLKYHVSSQTPTRLINSTSD